MDSDAGGTVEAVTRNSIVARFAIAIFEYEPKR